MESTNTDQASSPFPLPRPTRRMAIYASVDHALGLCADGSVVATGSFETGRRDVEDWKDIVAVSAGWDFSVGLRADGTVVATGDNRFGQCDVGDWRDIVAIDAGVYYTVGLRADGSVVATGDDLNGRCDVGGWQGIVAIAADCHTLGLRQDGSVVAAGCDEDYCRDMQEWQGVTAIATNVHISAALLRDGCVAVLPRKHELCGDILKWRDVTAIAVGAYHMAALLQDGRVITAGRNINGCCNVQEWRGVTAIAARHDYTLGLLADGSVVAVGDNDHDQCGASRWQLAQPGAGMVPWSVDSKDPWVRLRMAQKLGNLEVVESLTTNDNHKIRALAIKIFSHMKLVRQLNAVLANELQDGSLRVFLTESLDDVGLLRKIFIQKNCSIELAIECIRHLCNQECKKEDVLSLAETLIGRVRQESSPKSLKPIVSYFCGQFSDDELKQLGFEIRRGKGYWNMRTYYMPTKVYFEGELLLDENLYAGEA